MTTANKIDEIQARREARRKALADARVKQLELDLERLDALEEEHGYERVLRIDLPGWDPSIGGPSLVVARVPKSSEGLIKRFETTIHKSKEGSNERIEAQCSLARACLVYPDPSKDAETYQKVLDTAPAILSSVALIILKAAQGIAEQEGKG